MRGDPPRRWEVIEPVIPPLGGSPARGRSRARDYVDSSSLRRTSRKGKRTIAALVKESPYDEKWGTEDLNRYMGGKGMK